ncbi:hypothetical protein CYMTET_34193 [Cymbomonas tetramitiformis]|uniref:Uncharacterized protein n=1 Tax=Cymbomonas tetramitiformis TaxID=36881 RepID=A0AAE0FBN7_9CHLO|nr:hypothetical protein CYMTET_34193 [Cymbomonas tetramitiformis]
MNIRQTGNADTIRVYNRALELLQSRAPDAEEQLVQMVKKAKRENENTEPIVKRATPRTGNGMAQSAGASAAVTARTQQHPEEASKAKGTAIVAGDDLGTPDVAGTASVTVQASASKTVSRSGTNTSGKGLEKLRKKVMR